SPRGTRFRSTVALTTGMPGCGVATRGRTFTVCGGCRTGRFPFCARETDVTSAEGHRATGVWSAVPAVIGKLDTNANRARSRGQAEIRINVYGSKRVLPIT